MTYETDPMTTPDIRTNWQKFLLLTFSLGIMLTLVLVGRVEWEAMATPFGIIVGYGAANGIGAVKGTQPAPLFAPLLAVIA